MSFETCTQLQGHGFDYHNRKVLKLIHLKFQLNDSGNEEGQSCQESADADSLKGLHQQVDPRKRFQSKYLFMFTLIDRRYGQMGHPLK